MVIIETGADDTNFGKLVCEWDENTALLFIRGRAEKLLRGLLELLKPAALSRLPTETEIQKGLDELMIDADALFEKYAPEVFYAAQVRLVSDVLSKVLQDIPESIHLRDEQGQVAGSMADFIDMQSLKDHRKKMTEFFKAKHNELIGIKRGPRAKVSIKKIIERLRDLPKGVGLQRLATEMNVTSRAIQYALKDAGLTFEAAKRKAKK
jgi:hypothetical protein